MAALLARDQQVDLEFYGTEGGVLILASWDEDPEGEQLSLDVEVLAKYFALNGGSV
jgi:hypothetical protein